MKIHAVVDVVVLLSILHHRVMSIGTLRPQVSRGRLSLPLQAVLETAAVGVAAVPHFVLLGLRKCYLLIVVRQNVVVAVVHVIILTLS